MSEQKVHLWNSTFTFNVQNKLFLFLLNIIIAEIKYNGIIIKYKTVE